MITMKEMVERFKPILNRVEDKKETFEDSIKIPYPNLEQICGEFAPGECYTFFGGAEDNALWIMHLQTGYLSYQEFQSLQKSLECIANYLITWHEDEDVPEENKTSVCIKTVSLEDWQNFEPCVLWPQVKERNKVLFFFVKLPKGVPACWNSIYARNRIILPEEFSSYIGFVQLQEVQDFNLHSPHKELHLNIRNTHFLSPGSCCFDYDSDTGKIEPI